MGVPLLLSWLRQYCGVCFTPAKQRAEDGYTCDNLYIDLNSILYSAVKAAMDDNQEALDARHQRGGRGGGGIAAAVCSGEHFEVLVLQHLVVLLDDIIFNLAHPQRLVYLAADGVSPKGKMARQRERRIANAKRFSNVVAKETLGWDVNGVTSGTPFMLRASKVIEWYVASRVQQQQQRGNEQLSIIVSDGMTPGEGEYKIFEYIRSCRESAGYDPNTRHCICSTDTDVVVCSLPLHEPHIDVLRMADAVDTAPMLFSIERFRSLLYKRMLQPSDPQVYERGLHDVVFILLLFGNDFLPSIFDVDIGGGHLDRLLDFLVSDFITRQHNLTDPGRNALDAERIVYFLENVEACTEAVAGFTMRSRNNYSNKNAGAGARAGAGAGGGGGRAPLVINLGEGGIALNPWDGRQAAQAAAQAAAKAAAVVEKRAEDFVVGLQWALQYYCGRCVSWTWCYMHTAPPTPPQLCEALRRMSRHRGDGGGGGGGGLAMTFDDAVASTANVVPVFEQLVVLLPETSKSLLPVCFQRAYDELRPLLEVDFTRISFDAVHRKCVELQSKMSAAERERVGTRNGAPYGAFLGVFLQQQLGLGPCGGSADGTLDAEEDDDGEGRLANGGGGGGAAPLAVTDVGSCGWGDNDLDDGNNGLFDVAAMMDDEELAAMVADAPPVAAAEAPPPSAAPLAEEDGVEKMEVEQEPPEPKAVVLLETRTFHLDLVDPPPRPASMTGFRSCGDALSRVAFATDLRSRPPVHLIEIGIRASDAMPTMLLPGCETNLMVLDEERAKKDAESAACDGGCEEDALASKRKRQ